jgi:hypothetical protein
MAAPMPRAPPETSSERVDAEADGSLIDRIRYSFRR